MTYIDIARHRTNPAPTQSTSYLASNGTDADRHVKIVVIPSVASSLWWSQFIDELAALRDSGFHFVRESDVLTSHVVSLRLQKVQTRLMRHATNVAAILAPYGLVDSSIVHLPQTPSDILIQSDALRLSAWKWWNVVLDLRAHRQLLKRPPTRSFAVKWEWLDGPEVHAGTVATRAALLVEAAERKDGPIAILATPMMAAYLERRMVGG